MWAPADVLMAVYGIAAPILITIHVLRRRRITTDVIFGALCVYVFLGIDFAVLYGLIERVDPGAFTGDEGSLFYFSFMTLTTVGYGDIIPVANAARAATVIEALMGQVVLVAMVARLVGLQIAQSSREG